MSIAFDMDFTGIHKLSYPTMKAPNNVKWRTKNKNLWHISDKVIADSQCDSLSIFEIFLDLLCLMFIDSCALGKLTRLQFCNIVTCYRPQGKIMFSQVCVVLSTIGLMATRLLLILGIVRAVCILLECFIFHILVFFLHLSLWFSSSCMIILFGNVIPLLRFPVMCQSDGFVLGSVGHQ